MSNLLDIDHYFGDDIGVSPTGDLQTASGTLRGQQRVLRRLLTNPGDYIFHPEYGAGLPSKIGSLINAAEIIALIRGQMLLEESVAQTPEPKVEVRQINDGMAVNISYVDAISLQPVALSFNVTR